MPRAHAPLPLRAGAVLLACLLLPVAGAPRARPARADGGARSTRGPAPQQNFSDLHASEEWVLRAFLDADRAQADGRHAEAARLLQGVVDATTRPGPRPEAAPHVVPIQGTSTYEGAWLVARHRQLSGGDELLDALGREFGAAAEALVRRGIDGREATRLEEAALRFLPLPAGRRAALLLADRALERGDRDEALEWCQALEDAEAVSGESAARLAPWRAARIARHARALAAGPDDVEPLRRGLAARAAHQHGPDRGLGAVPWQHVAPPNAPAQWLTSGGDHTRNARAPALGTALELAWSRGPGDPSQLADTVDPEDGGPRRPSTFLPPRAVVLGARAVVSDGTALRVFGIADGEFQAFTRFRAYRDIGHDTDADRRIGSGWIEGHALTAHRLQRRDARAGTREDAWLVLAAVPDGRPWTAVQEEREVRADHLEAFLLVGNVLRPLWQAGGGLGDTGATGLDEHLRLYGAPLVYRDRVWIAGVVPSASSRDRLESWIVSLDPLTGAVRTRTHIGSGTAVRPSREDEIMPTSPAAAAGRVVIGTSLGLVAAVSARDGRLAWGYRYDRDVEVDRAARGRRAAETLEPRSISFENEPPRLGLERCVLAPTDGHDVLVLFDRPIGPERELLSYAIDRRREHVDFHPESVVGLLADPTTRATPWLITVGQGLDTGEVPGPLATARDLVTGRMPWDAQAGLAAGTRSYGASLLTTDALWVPTREGLAVFALPDGARRALRTGGLHEGSAWTQPTLPYGNLVPVGGEGLLAVSATTVSYWRSRRP